VQQARLVNVRRHAFEVGESGIGNAGFEWSDQDFVGRNALRCGRGRAFKRHYQSVPIRRRCLDDAVGLVQGLARDVDAPRHTLKVWLCATCGVDQRRHG
jgi:hypothetical protein